MLRGLYTAAAGMNLQLSRQDAIANNLANINTVGYKKDELIGAAFQEVLFLAMKQGEVTPIGTLSLGVESEQNYTQLTPGNLLTTENPLDLAIIGDGYFLIEGPTGQYLTRNGHFSRNAEGYLVTTEGDYVLGENGPLRLVGDKIEFGDDGSIYLDGQFRERLLIVSPVAENLLVKQGDTRFLAPEGWTRLAAPHVNQGVLENSNVNPIEEMTKMIAVTRAYESNQKVIAVMDEVMNRIANDLGRV
ncbi:MAG: flagellar basal-body rod protein FlgF [Firmicutes bacterium]|nr:flagellar basal-body rod protein FlgF [Bacillota bacterium]